VRLVSIYSREDKVSPFPCCRLEDEGVGNTFNVEIPGLSHREYLYKRAAYEAIRAELARTYGGEVEPPPQPVTLSPVRS
jgi:triacylglycerol lipase